MQNNWKTYKLGEISTDVSYGYTESSTMEVVGPKFLRITDIQKDYISWETVPYCPINKKNLVKYRLEIGDIVIARTGNSTGETILIKDNVEAVFASYLIRFKIDNAIANPSYVSYVLRTHFWKGFVDGVKSGSAQPGANAKQFSSFELNIPPLPEQHAIASILSTIDDQIENNLAMNKTLEEMSMALYKHWFVDFGPFQDGSFVESELGEIPEGWEVSSLENHLEIKYGKDHKKLEEGNIPVYGTGGIMRYVNKSLYEKDSILIPRKGSLGNVYYISEPFWTVDTLFYSIIKNSAYSKFLYYKVKNMDLASMDVGSAIPSLTTALLKKLRIIVPPENEVVKFETQITEYFNIINHNLKENQTLIEQRDALLPKLVSGEVRVKGFE